MVSGRVFPTFSSDIVSVWNDDIESLLVTACWLLAGDPLRNYRDCRVRPHLVKAVKRAAGEKQDC